MLRLSAAVRREKLDVFFSPSVYGYFPLPPGLPGVVTIHDAIPERFPELTLPTWKDRVFWRMKVALAIRQARLFVTTSPYGAAEIAEHLAIPRDRVRVTLVGISDTYHENDTPAEIQTAAARVGIPNGGRWFIYVGGFGPHKHVDLIVRAHAAVARRHPNPPLTLLLVGPYRDAFHSDTAGIRAAVDIAGTAGLVKWTGFLPDEELRHLHTGAVALVLVSASEGFGLTAVEAARCGAPVIAATASPLPQVLEGGGLFVEPGNVGQIETAMERLVTNEAERQAMGQRALARARELSWSRSAQAALEAIAEAATTPQP
jgi:alpha-1,3-rhamnosyl/mannosyltransferase